MHLESFTIKSQIQRQLARIGPNEILTICYAKISANAVHTDGSIDIDIGAKLADFQ
jgi:hypothetical protein